MAFRPDRLTTLRKAHGYKQTELASELSLTQNQISQYERGIISPSADTLTALAQKLNTTADYLLDLSPVPHPGAAPDPLPDLTPTEIEVLRLLRSYPPDDQKRLLEALTVLRSIGGTDADS